jgi:hypothetical protein
MRCRLRGRHADLARLVAGTVAMLAAILTRAESRPRFPGADTSVAVNRTNGKVAVCQGGTLMVYDSIRAPEPTTTIELPGEKQAVREFRGNTLVYVANRVEGMARVFVALLADGRERMAWPNEGISELFPNEESHLTVDGRGIYGRLVLDGSVQELFGLSDSIPLGSGVVATYRFAGEKLSARGSEVFGEVVAISPDDMLIGLRDGGVLRYKAPGGVAWKLDRADKTSWRLTDVDLGAGLVLVAVDGTVLNAVDLEKGELRWSWDVRTQARVPWLGVTAAPTPPASPSTASGRTSRRKRDPLPTPTPTPLPVASNRIFDARLLVDGRVLVLGRGEQLWLGVLDPRAGQLGATELLAAFERVGMSGLSSLWERQYQTLAGLDEARLEGRSYLLVHGPSGWYEATLP